MESTHLPTHSWFHETILECLLCARPWAHTHPWAAPGCTWEVSNVHIPQHRLRHCSAESWTLAPEILTNLGRDVGIYIFTSSPGDSAEDGPWVILHCLPWGRDDRGAVPHPSQGQGPCQRTAESCALKGQGPRPSLPTCTLVTLPPPCFRFTKESDLLPFFMHSDAEELPPPTPPGMSIFFSSLDNFPIIIIVSNSLF